MASSKGSGTKISGVSGHMAFKKVGSAAPTSGQKGCNISTPTSIAKVAKKGK